MDSFIKVTNLETEMIPYRHTFMVKFPNLHNLFETIQQEIRVEVSIELRAEENAAHACK